MNHKNIYFIFSFVRPHTMSHLEQSDNLLQSLYPFSNQIHNEQRLDYGWTHKYKVTCVSLGVIYPQTYNNMKRSNKQCKSRNVRVKPLCNPCFKNSSNSKEDFAPNVVESRECLVVQNPMRVTSWPLCAKNSMT